MNDELKTLLAETFLASLPADAVDPLLVGAQRIEVAAGSRICPAGGPAAIRLVVGGLVRIHVVSPDGRSVTQRYLRRGDIGGIPAYFHGKSGSGECQALVDSVYYVFRSEAWHEAAQRDARVAFALLEEVSHILVTSIDHLASEALGSMRQRVARQLLDLAADGQRGRDLVAPVTQQQLAEGMGTVREVVARALRELRDRGAVQTIPRGILIVDPQALRSELDAVA